MGKYFGTDGFRGRVGESINSLHAYETGRFLGWYFGAKDGQKCRVVIGKDPRLSSYTIEYALAAGITASGGDAYVMHVTTTPSIAFVCRTDKFDCGVVVSASHNVYCDNGLKIFNCRGEKMDDEVLRLIEKYLDGDIKSVPFAVGKNIGKVVDYVAGRNRYTGHLIALSDVSFKGYKIGLDCANGSAYKIAKNVFNALGATVYAIGDEPNGLNINDGVGSTNIGAIQRYVTDNGLDAGFAFDGDADRCLCIDETGIVRDGDSILYMLATEYGAAEDLNGVVATIMSNSGLKESLEQCGIKVHICDVGDRNVYKTMTDVGCYLGGEQSGHIIIGKIENVGDGIVAALAIMQIIVKSKMALSSHFGGLKLYPQIVESVDVKNKLKILNDPDFCTLIAREKSMLKHGRILIRRSGTEEKMRVLVESDDCEECKRLCDKIVVGIKLADEKNDVRR